MNKFDGDVAMVLDALKRQDADKLFDAGSYLQSVAHEGEGKHVEVLGLLILLLHRLGARRRAEDDKP